MIARNGLLVTATLFFVVGCSAGGAIARNPPAPPAGPPAFANNIDTLANQQISSGLVPSLEIGVERRGQMLFDRPYGLRSLAPAIVADASTDYQIASLTKAFTAAAVLLLVQDGKLSLDDPLERFVPEYPPATHITLRQMLNMVSGIPSDPNDSFTTLYGSIDHESVVQRLAQFPLDFAPGSRFEYANANYWLLGLVIERVSGVSYGSFVTSRILTPLGLVHTTYLANSNAPDTAAGYWHSGNAGGPFQLHPSWSPDYLFSMGGLVSDAPDLLRWDESLRTPGLLQASSLATMFNIPDRAISAYGMGWFVDPDGTRWHDGESGGFNSANGLFADGYDVVILGNTWDQYAGALDPIALLQAVHAALPP